MPFVPLRRHALMTAAGIATAVVVPLAAVAAGPAFAAGAADPVPTTTITETPVASPTTTPTPTPTGTTTTTPTPTAPTAAQVAAAKRAAAKKAAEKKAAAKRAAERRKALAKRKAAAEARARVVARGVKIVKVAERYKGRPYVYGASGPRAFDCSGFTRFVVAKALHVSLPHNAAAQAYSPHVKRVSAKNRMVGDLVFFGRGHGIYHVGIYAGHGRMWAAPHTGSTVRLEAIYTSAVSYGQIV